MIKTDIIFFKKICWPHAKIYIKQTLLDVVEPIINQYSTSLIGKIKFKELDLGDTVTKINIAIAMIEYFIIIWTIEPLSQNVF